MDYVRLIYFSALNTGKLIDQVSRESSVLSGLALQSFIGTLLEEKEIFNRKLETKKLRN